MSRDFMTVTSPRVRCREIGPADLRAVLSLLHHGFPERTRDHFARALERLSVHRTPPGLPRFGYMLEAGDAAVGVILVIFSVREIGGERHVRGNVASWYVDPAFRTYAAMLTSHALAHKNVTYLNISAARHTWPILEAQGYRQLCAGQFVALPALRGGLFSARVYDAPGILAPGGDLTAAEIELLHEHTAYGCSSVICEVDGKRRPFVFAKGWTKWKRLPLPFALLVYCRGVDDFIEQSGPLGRFLARRGMPVVFIDANGPIPGMRGRFVDWDAKFYRGGDAPPLGDIAYTERVMFEL
jgi:hypothetical protein